jgi:D-tyrosyl-tRNA(Tyr) deacylase
MITLLQRVLSAKVHIDNKIYSEINQGILLFVGLEKEDSNIDFKDFETIISKIINFRIFNDSDNKMNLSIKDIQGEILIVSQFTLAAETQKGLRPGFSTAMPPELAEPLYNKIVACFKEKYSPIKTGVFGADMKIELINNGPVTFLMNH